MREKEEEKEEAEKRCWWGRRTGERGRLRNRDWKGDGGRLLCKDEVQEREVGKEDEGRRRKAALDGVKATASTARRRLKEVERERLSRDAAACRLAPIATGVTTMLCSHAKGVIFEGFDENWRGERVYQGLRSELFAFVTRFRTTATRRAETQDIFEDLWDEALTKYVYLLVVIEGDGGVGDCGVLIVLTGSMHSAPLILPFSHHPDHSTHAPTPPPKQGVAAAGPPMLPSSFHCLLAHSTASLPTNTTHMHVWHLPAAILISLVTNSPSPSPSLPSLPSIRRHSHTRTASECAQCSSVGRLKRLW